MSVEDVLKAISKNIEFNFNIKSEKGKQNIGLNFRETQSKLEGNVDVEIESEKDPKVNVDLGVKNEDNVEKLEM